MFANIVILKYKPQEQTLIIFINEYIKNKLEKYKLPLLQKLTEYHRISQKNID